MNAEYARIRAYLRAQAAKLEPPAIVDKVRAAMGDLRTAAGRVPAARFAERPAPDEWSGNEVLAHVVEAGRFFGGAIVAILDGRPVPASPRERPPVTDTRAAEAWLATLEPNDAVQRVARHGGFSGAHRYGPNVIRSIEALLKELRTTSRRGYGLALNEAEPGVTAVAAAIRSGTDGATVGTVSIAGPSARMTENRVRELAPLVTQCATELSSLWPVRPKHVSATQQPPRRQQVVRERESAKSVGKRA